MRTNGKIQLYPFLRLAIMLMIGIVVGRALQETVTWLLWGGGCVTALTFAFFSCDKIKQTTFTFLSILFLGAMITQHKLASLNMELPRGKVAYEAIIVSQPVEKGKVVRCDLLVTQGLSVSPANVRGTILKDTLTGMYRGLRVGDAIMAYGYFEKPRAYNTGNNFNYPLWMQSHGFVGQSFVACDDWAWIPLDTRQLSVWKRLQLKALIMRERVLRQLRHSGLSGQEKAVVAAMTLGEKSMISQQTRDDYAATGVSHVLALSGLHLGILFQIILLLTGNSRRRVASACLLLLAIWTYVFFVGMPASVIRSAVMITVYSFVCLLRRSNVSLNSLSVAAVFMLIYNPLYLYDVSFQLSFMAVLSILIYQPLLYKSISIWWLMKHRVARWIWSLFTVSLAAQIGTLPIVVYYFKQLSCYALLANFIAIPAATFILYLAFVMLVCSPVSFVSQLVGKLLAFIAEGLNVSLAYIAKLPGASVDDINVTLTQLLLVYVIIAAVTLLYSKMSSTVKSSVPAPSSFKQGL